MEKKSLLKRIGVSGYNKPKRTPNHPTKSHVVVAKVGDKVEFFYESRTKDGRIFHNIKGNIKKVATAESTGSSSVTPTSATLPTKDISIIRQSSTTNAVKVAELMIQQGGKYDEQQLMTLIKRVRANFVKYSSLQDTEEDDKEPNEGVVALKAAQ